MFIKMKEIISLLKNLNINSINEDIYLCFDNIRGFYFYPEEENNKWKWLIEELNNKCGVKEYYTVKEIANHLKMSYNSVMDIIKRNKIPYINTPKGIRINSIDYYNFLMECKIEPKK